MKFLLTQFHPKTAMTMATQTTRTMISLWLLSHLTFVCSSCRCLVQIHMSSSHFSSICPLSYPPISCCLFSPLVHLSLFLSAYLILSQVPFSSPILSSCNCLLLLLVHILSFPICSSHSRLLISSHPPSGPIVSSSVPLFCLMPHPLIWSGLLLIPSHHLILPLTPCLFLSCPVPSHHSLG